MKGASAYWDEHYGASHAAQQKSSGGKDYTHSILVTSALTRSSPAEKVRLDFAQTVCGKERSALGNCARELYVGVVVIGARSVSMPD